MKTAQITDNQSSKPVTGVVLQRFVRQFKYVGTLYMGICAWGQTKSFATAFMLVGLAWLMIIEEEANDKLREECIRMSRILEKVVERLPDAQSEPRPLEKL